MAIPSIVQPLQHVALFQGLCARRLHDIARRAERIVFKAGEAIATVDQPAAGAVLIVAGEARRVAGPGVDAAEVLPPGTLVGEMGMLVETISSSTVVAATPVRALRLAREEMLDLMTRDPQLADHFVACITARLHDVAAEMRGIEAGLGDALERDPGEASLPALAANCPSPARDETASLH